MILSFRTEMPGQTERTQIRSSLIRVYTVCHSVCIIWTDYFIVEPQSSNFRVITTNVLGVRIFRKFRVAWNIWHAARFCLPANCSTFKGVFLLNFCIFWSFGDGKTGKIALKRLWMFTYHSDLSVPTFRTFSIRIKTDCHTERLLLYSKALSFDAVRIFGFALTILKSWWSWSLM